MSDACDPRNSGTDTGKLKERVGQLKEGILEMLYPTRCALCDLPDTLLCDACREHMEFIDHDSACPYCGAPASAVQCTECGGAGSFPFSGCRAIGSFDEDFSQIVRTYKDAGERRLASVIAQLMAVECGADWRSWAQGVCFVPATMEAYRRRGFDHMELIAQEFCRLTHLPLADLLIKKDTQDQRGLSAAERQENMASSFSVVGEQARRFHGKDLLLLDDVFTTGATLTQATDTLLAAGIHEVRALVFCRVW